MPYLIYIYILSINSALQAQISVKWSFPYNLDGRQTHEHIIIIQCDKFNDGDVSKIPWESRSKVTNSGGNLYPKSLGEGDPALS